MARYRVQGPDGAIHVFEGPDNATPAQVEAFAAQTFGSQTYPEPSAVRNAPPIVGGTPGATAGDSVGAQPMGPNPATLTPLDTLRAAGSQLRDIGAGAVRGAGSIGSTILYGIDKLRAPQLSELVTGETPATRDTARRADMDAALAQLTGTDPNSGYYAGGKMAGEVAGTAGIGGAAGNLIKAGLARVGLAAPTVVNALATGGFRTGAAPATAGGKALDYATRAAAGGAVGGAATAMTGDREGTDLGAALGAALPVAAPLVAAGASKVGQVVRGAADVVSDDLARATAAKQAGQALGAGQLPANTTGIPLTAAAVSGSPALAQLEQGSRLRQAPAWMSFDETQAKAVADKVLGATKEADQLAQRIKERSANWAANWAKASDNIDPQAFSAGLADLQARLELAKKTPDAVNGRVMAALQEMQGTIERFGEGFTPAHLQQLRAEFNGKMKPLARTAMEAAPRDAPAIRTLVESMDNLLNAATSGKWDAVRAGYAKDSDLVRASKAAQLVRDKFIDPVTDMPVRAAGAAGTTPAVSEAALANAIRQSKTPEGASFLSDQAKTELASTLEALRKQNIVQRLKKTASAGGGSDTASNAISVLQNRVPGSNMILDAVDALSRVATSRRDRQMAQLLQDPEALANILTSMQPGPARQAAMDALMFGGRAAPVALLGGQ